ncbi:transposase [Streptomyces massasporeus]|uniref:transposase n=1 Tax=Streptomyces massasporeus TaxID=67324 RepID=UPI0036AF69B1
MHQNHVECCPPGQPLRRPSQRRPFCRSVFAVVPGWPGSAVARKAGGPSCRWHVSESDSSTSVCEGSCKELSQTQGVPFGQSDCWSGCAVDWRPVGGDEPLLLDQAPRRGGRWQDHRQVIDAVAFKDRNPLPANGPARRARSGQASATACGSERPTGRERIFTDLPAQADAEGDLDWVVAVDSTIAPAHQHATGARQEGPGRRAGRPCPRTLPRRLTTKIHLAAEGRCRPVAFHLTPGHAGDTPAFTHVMSRWRGPRPLGQPRTTSEVVPADKAYPSHALRTLLRCRGIRAVIPQPADHIATHKHRGQSEGRPPGCDKTVFGQRNTESIR